MIHEFLADRKAVNQHDGGAFAQMILQGVYPGSGLDNNLINPFFSSNIKRRLFMITTSNTPTYSYLRRISGLVLMVSSLFVLALSIQRATAQQAVTPKAKVETKALVTDTTKAVKKATAQKLMVRPTSGNGDQISITLDSIATNKNGNLDIRGTGSVVTSTTINGKVTPNASTVTISAQNVQITDGGKTPLYIVDGKEVTPALTKALDPTKIATVDVMTGENAIATYGKQAEHGVVIIHLKTEAASEVGKKMIIQSQTSKIPANTLFVLDGKVITSEKMNTINPNRIETMNVLKGEKATEKYGVKGKEGVIEISLKKDNV